MSDVTQNKIQQYNMKPFHRSSQWKSAFVIDATMKLGLFWHRDCFYFSGEINTPYSFIHSFIDLLSTTSYFQYGSGPPLEVYSPPWPKLNSVHLISLSPSCEEFGHQSFLFNKLKAVGEMAKLQREQYGSVLPKEEKSSQSVFSCSKFPFLLICVPPPSLLN